MTGTRLSFRKYFINEAFVLDRVGKGVSMLNTSCGVYCLLFFGRGMDDVIVGRSSFLHFLV